VSLKEKLEAMKYKVAGKEEISARNMDKSKNKEVL
jgi:hypothetical protein